LLRWYNNSEGDFRLIYMETFRKVKKIIASKSVTDGAGVKINRVFGYYEVPQFDPFLLLDHFKSDNPADYMAGFPWHPHRGIETVTYMLKGVIEHGDSLGNKGFIGLGDLQWMTAGSGIIHQEMPKSELFGIEGFQLWVNLRSENKMCSPAYQGIIREEIPMIITDNNVKIKLISGEFDNEKGPVKGIYANPEFLDVVIPPDTTFEYSTHSENNVFAYVYKGGATFAENTKASAFHVVLFGEGDSIKVSTGKEEIRFLLLAGKPIKEPIAWRGPIVMNTEEELVMAFAEYENNAFIR
jgi:redox-sensitive bicupin YhaK (pirin superfamily)